MIIYVQNLDLYIFSEPCMACAVALVHGRIKNVFYRMDRSGIFYKKKINYLKSLNHRYDVIKNYR